MNNEIQEFKHETMGDKYYEEINDKNIDISSKSHTSTVYNSVSSSRSGSFSSPKLSSSLGTNYTLKYVLRNTSPELDTTPRKEDDTVSVSTVASSSATNDQESNQSLPKLDLSQNEQLKLQTLNEKLNSLLNSNQILKTKLTQAGDECKRINNNLKLFLIITVLSTETRKKDEEDESLICMFKLPYFYSSNLPESNSKIEVKTELSVFKDCICVLTNRNLIILNILNQDLFNQNSDFEKSLQKEIIIDINQIEIIELGLGLSYLIVETINKNNKIQFFKFDTFNIYQTRTFQDCLSSM